MNCISKYLWYFTVASLNRFENVRKFKILEKQSDFVQEAVLGTFQLLQYTITLHKLKWIIRYFEYLNGKK